MIDTKKIQLIYELLKNGRFNLQDEKVLQCELYAFLTRSIPIEDIQREFKLDDKSIIDFLLWQSIGIEVKIKGQKRAIYKQCERYCHFEHIKTLILVTNRSMGFPEQLNGKDCYVLNLGKAWL